MMITVSTEANVREVIEATNNGGIRCACVVDGEGRLCGLVTDGDIRRSILDGVSLEASVSKIMNPSPVTMPASAPIETVRAALEEGRMLHMPLVDEEGVLVDLAYQPELASKEKLTNRVAIMAGGLGERLRPFTERVPKPMVEVGGRPIIRTIVDNLVAAGLTDITLCVNYLAHMLEDYLQDGSQLGARISYVREKERTGTGGALRLLSDWPVQDFFVMNGDILTSLDYSAMLEQHTSNNALATMAVKQHSHEIPYGVVETDGNRIKGFREKPRHTWNVNAGIYVLSPRIREFMPEETFFNLPTLFENVVSHNGSAEVFAISENWMDIGRPDDVSRAENVLKQDKTKFQLYSSDAKRR